MMKRLMTLVAIVSAIACLAAVAWGVRSFWVCEEFGYWAMNQYGVTSNRGVIRFYRDARFEDERSPETGAWTTRQDPTSVPPRVRHFHRGAEDIGDRLFTEFNVEHHNRRTGLWVSDMVTVTVPHWFVAGLLAMFPTWWFLGRRRQIIADARRREGRCPACGYDLRASPQRCPECGSAKWRRFLSLLCVDRHPSMTNPRPAVI
jgi:hypothetical protein